LPANVPWINRVALLSLIVVGLEARLRERRIAIQNVGRADTLGLCLAAVAAFAIVLVAITAPDELPPLVSGPHFTALNAVTSWIAVVLLAAGVAVISRAGGKGPRRGSGDSPAPRSFPQARPSDCRGAGGFRKLPQPRRRTEWQFQPLPWPWHTAEPVRRR